MNIQEILKKLNAVMPDSEIAKAIGTSQPTITRLRNGVHKSTTWERAEAIRGLAKKHRILKKK